MLRSVTSGGHDGGRQFSELRVAPPSAVQRRRVSLPDRLSGGRGAAPLLLRPRRVHDVVVDLKLLVGHPFLLPVEPGPSAAPQILLGPGRDEVEAQRAGEVA